MSMEHPVIFIIHAVYRPYVKHAAADAAVRAGNAPKGMRCTHPTMTYDPCRCGGTGLALLQAQLRQHLERQGLRVLLARVQVHVGVLRGLVWRIDAGEIPDLARVRGSGNWGPRRPRASPR